MKQVETQPPHLAPRGLKSSERLAGLTPLDLWMPGGGREAAAFGACHRVPPRLAGDHMAFGPELVKMPHAMLRFSSKSSCSRASIQVAGSPQVPKQVERLRNKGRPRRYPGWGHTAGKILSSDPFLSKAG